jgi:PAS domain S-box-containing protein
VDVRLSALCALGHRLSAARNAREAAQIIVDAADQLLGWDACFLDLYSAAEDTLTHVLNSDMVDGRRLEFTPNHNHKPPSALVQRAIAEGGQLVLKEDPSKMLPEGLAFGDTSRPSASIMFVPIRNGSEVIGVLSIQSYAPGAYDSQSLETLQALADHCGGALARIQCTEALQRRAEMENVVSKLLSGFVNLAPGETDAAIAHALEVVATFTSADHCCVFHCPPGSRIVCNTHQWQAEGVEACLSTPGSPSLYEGSWWMQELRRNKLICLPDIAALPPEAAAEKQFFDAKGVKSVLAVPLRYGDSLLSFLRLSSIRCKRRWTEEHIALLKIVGEIITNALQHKRAAQRILRLNQLYSVLTKINGLIVRSPPLEVLCEEACSILVDGGHFRAAWVGMVEPGTRAIKLVAHCGLDQSDLSGLRLSAAGDVPEGLGPASTAIREGRYDLCTDTDQDPRMAPWRELIAQHHVRSVAAFPLKANGRTVGALTLCHTEAYAFDEEAISLLEQLTGDLSFAIEVAGQARQLRLQRTALEAAANGIVITDPDGVISWVNAAFTKLTGYTVQEAVGKKPSVLKSGKHEAQFYQQLWSTIAGGQVWRGEIINRRKDGSLYTEEMTITPVRGENGAITHYVAIKQDITERKNAERRMAALSGLGQQLSAVRTAREAAEIIVAVAQQLIGWDACSLGLYSPEQDRLSCMLNKDTINGQRVDCTAVYPDAPPSPCMRRAIDGGGQLILREEPYGMLPGATPFGDTSRPSASILFVPVRDGSAVVGVLSIHSYTPRAYDQQSLDTLQALADHCGGALGRIRAQEALNESEANYRLLVESSPDAKFVHSEGRFVYANPAALKLLRAADPQQLLGRNVLDIVPPENRAFIRQRIQWAVAGEMFSVLEQKILRLDGTTIDVEARGVPFTHQGKPAVQVIMRDIWERKQAEARPAAISALGHRLSAAQTAKDAARIIVDVADQLIGWDSCICAMWSETDGRLTDVLNADLINGRRTECSPSYDNDRPSPTVRRAITEGGQLILRGQTGNPRLDSHAFGDEARRSASLMFVPIRNGAKVIGLLSIQSYTPNAYDQTSLETLQVLADHCGAALDRIRTEEELRWKTAFLEAHANSAPAGLLLVDNQGKKFLQNQRLVDMWKISGEIAADPDDSKQVQFIAQKTNDPQQFLERVRHLYSHPTESSCAEVEMTDGTILHRTSSPVVGKDGTVYGRIWAFRDITESRKLEAQLRQSQKMEAIGQLAGGVAHDFNNLLAVMRGNTELVLMDADQFGSEAADCLKQVVVAADRAAGLTRQLLAFGRKQLMQAQPLNLAQAVSNLTKMLKRIIGEDIDLQLRYAGHLPFVQADVGMIEQVLVNLVVNARDAMPHGGQVVITTESIRFDGEDGWEHPEARSGEFVCLSVTDSGTGIAPENLPRIFEPFYTTKDVGKGTGLGLATVYGIVKQHQGWIEVSSQLGSGSTFRIFLPAIPAPAAKPAAPQPEPDIPGGTETILLVEDDDSVRLITRRVLQSRGYKVYEACSARQGLELWHSHGEEVTLLLSDMVMPEGVTGRQLADQLRAQRAALKVIFLSGYSADVIGKDTDYFHRTGSHFLQKPASARTVLETVRRCLDEP